MKLPYFFGESKRSAKFLKQFGYQIVDLVYEATNKSDPNETLLIPVEFQYSYVGMKTRDFLLDLSMENAFFVHFSMYWANSASIKRKYYSKFNTF